MVRLTFDSGPSGSCSHLLPPDETGRAPPDACTGTVRVRASGLVGTINTSSASASGAGGLNERERRILEFEREAWGLRLPKERAIRETFGISATRYHQLLHRLVDRPEALAYDPMLVRRLRRLREIRRKRRTAQRLGITL